MKGQSTTPPQPIAKSMAEAVFGRETASAKVKRVTGNLCDAVVRVVFSVALIVAAVLLVIKLGMWVFG